MFPKKARPVVGKTTLPVQRKKYSIGQLAYAGFVLLASIVYGSFMYYGNRYLDIVIEDMQALRMTFPTKLVAGLALGCVVVWFILLAASVWRGRDIGFAKWQSIGVYIIPCLPRFLAMLFALDESIDMWIDTLSSVLWICMVGLFLYLPAGWYDKKMNKR